MANFNLKSGIFLAVLLNLIKTVPYYFGLRQFELASVPNLIIRTVDPVFFALEILIAYKVSLLILNRKNRITRVLQSFGNFSLEIYFIHAAFFFVLGEMLVKINTTPSNGLFYLVTWLTVLVLSYAFAFIYNKVKLVLKDIMLRAKTQ